MILGTNANLFHWLGELCGHSKGKALTCALNISSVQPKEEPGLPSWGGVDLGDMVGLVKCMGPDQLVLSPQESLYVPCQVNFCQQAHKGIVLVKTCDDMPLPQGLMRSVPLIQKFSLCLYRMRPNVKYSLHEWEVGLASEVEHHIQLSDSRPFRERSRHLSPADTEDVQNHIQDLLAAG